MQLEADVYLLPQTVGLQLPVLEQTSVSILKYKRRNLFIQNFAPPTSIVHCGGGEVGGGGGGGVTLVQVQLNCAYVSNVLIYQFTNIIIYLFLPLPSHKESWGCFLFCFFFLFVPSFK